MRIRHRQLFTAVLTEGAILPADLLQRIDNLDHNLGGISPEDYHLPAGVKLNEAINQSWNRMKGAWIAFQTARAKLAPNDTATTVTREKWLLPLFQELNYGRLKQTPTVEIEGRSYAVFNISNNVPIHLVGAGIDLDQRAAGVAGAAKMSPHGMVQELLNREDNYLWGFVSNGLQLRTLRDNVSLTRQAFVEFDLEMMMTGELYSDFAMLWLLCHESRVSADKAVEFWLEKWSKKAIEIGTRALDQLRAGVEDAIKSLGQGFLAHPANKPLLDKLKSGALDKQDYYRQLLRFVYRLIFLFVAEDRELLFPKETGAQARERYTRFYSLSRLRRLAGKRAGARHHDLYQGLRLVMAKLSGEEDNAGYAELGLPALGSFLFEKKAVEDLRDCEIENTYLLSAIRALAYLTDQHGLRTVDYKNLRSEELGGVYEALLELHPEINAEARHFDLPPPVAGNERKKSGSYYTPENLVQCLLDSALDPVVDEAIKQSDPERAILNLKICDPACGSGHFLIAAAHRLAKRLASIRTGDDEPSPAATRTALRDVIGHSIYGVDINPMAVELCKVSLWMEALEPGRPLSFLEHRIQCGNSLIGATPALLKKGIPDEAFKPIEGDDKAICAEYRRYNKQFRESGQRNIFESEIKLGALAQSVLSLEEVDDISIEGVREKQRRWEELVRSNDYLYGGLLADAWCAAFVWKKLEDRNHPRPISDEMFRKIEQGPWRVARTHHEIEIKRLAAQYQFFHWHLAFPDVFRAPANDEEPENMQAGWSGGFDVMLGNPPWERIRILEKEWFAQRRPEIVNASNAAARQRMIRELSETDPTLLMAFLNDRRKAEGESHFVRSSGRYPLCGRGDINTYAIFAETNRTIASKTGRVGCIVPSGVATDDTTKFFFQDLMESQSLASLYDFENREGLFPEVDSRMKFCLLTLTGEGKPAECGTEFIFFAHSVEDLSIVERHFTLSADEIALLNPNTRTCPTFRSQRDAEITKYIYSHNPILLSVSSNPPSPWGLYLARMYHMTDDAHLFRTRRQLEESGYFKDGLNYTLDESKYVRLYEGRLGHQFNHRFASEPEGILYETELASLANPAFTVEPHYYVPAAETDRLLNQRTAICRTALLGYRRVSRNTDERTSIACLLPWGAASYGWTLSYGPNAQDLCLLCGIYNSFAFDYLLRNSLSQPSIPHGAFQQIAAPHPTKIRDSLRGWMVAAVLELTYTAYDLRGFAEDCGYTGEPFRWDKERRFLLRCELDAAYFHLYGIGREEVDYILGAFPIVKRKDEQAHGEYRAKRVILEIYDEMKRAMAPGAAYQTRLAPPPANGWTPPELPQGEVEAIFVAPPAMFGSKQQSDLFAWQSEDPQQELQFEDKD